MRLFIFLILLFELTYEKYLILNIKRDDTKLNQITRNYFIKNEEIIEALFYNNIFSLINIGKPKRELKLYLSFNTSKTIINNKKYSKLQSVTYRFNNETNESIDLLELNQNKINDYCFDLLESENIKNNDLCIIGLNPSNENMKNTNFLFQLKKYGLINERLFSFVIKENPENNYFAKELLLIGELPEEYDSNFFSNSKINWSPIILNENNINNKWKIKIEYFFIDENENNNCINRHNSYIEFILENNLIIASDIYRNYFLNNFLNIEVSKEICKEDYFYNERNQKFYVYYECRKIDRFKNKILYFKSKELNETFEINLSNLFYEYNRKFFFGIIFDAKNTNYFWQMGKIFYEKYSFVFDDEKKRIGYYRIEKEKENPYIILLSFISFSCFIILMTIIGYINKRNKMKDLNKKEKLRENKGNKAEKEKKD